MSNTLLFIVGKTKKLYNIKIIKNLTFEIHMS